MSINISFTFQYAKKPITIINKPMTLPNKGQKRILTKKQHREAYIIAFESHNNNNNNILLII